MPMFLVLGVLSTGDDFIIKKDRHRGLPLLKLNYKYFKNQEEFIMKKTGLLLLVFIFTFSLFGSSFGKIPAFARKYGYSCKTCHTPFPKLKAYGEEFAGNAFREKEEPRSAYKNAGDDKLLLMRDLPIGMRMDLYFNYDSESKTKTDLKTPYILKLLSGGSISENIGYYFYFFFSERGEVAGIEDAYIHFNNIFGSELDIMAGQFQVSDPLMKRELRLTYEDYMPYKLKRGFSNANLTYDRGLMLTYGLPSGTDLTMEILNGNGKPEANEDRNYDTDSEKALAFRVSQNISFLRLGGFYYYAKESMFDEKNTVKWYGPDLTVGNDKIELNAQYLVREDSNPLNFDGINGKEVVSFIAEMTLMPKGDESDWIGTFLYNFVENRYQSATASLTYMVRRNLRMLAEYTRDIDYDKNRFVFGFVSGF